MLRLIVRHLFNSARPLRADGGGHSPMHPDYEPLDLSAVCNAGLEAYQRDPSFPADQGGDWPGTPPTGAQVLRGLPFQIGGPGGGARCFVALGAGGAVVVPVGRAARWVIFLHALLETQLWQGGPVGETVATYRVRLTGGAVHDLPIRERLEIGNLPLPWGQFPLLAVPDRHDSLMPRRAGPWEAVGERQTEAEQAWPAGYYLWAWANPQPEAAIESIELLPAGRGVVVAGITLGYLEENPLRQRTRRPVRITRLEGGPAPAGDLEVQVDRGVATYVYPLPTDVPGEAMAGYAGFGAPLNEAGSPAYVEVAAPPSATLTVKQGEASLGQVRWGELGAQGTATLPGARLEVLGAEKNWVHVSVVDDDTGQPLPCRVAFLSPEGVPYPPHGHHAPLFSNMGTWHIDVGGDVRLGQISYAYTDGTCQGWLPRGRVLVDAAAGFEYVPQRGWLTVAPGQQRLEVRLRRWVDMNAAGWYSGDTHVHFLSSQGAVMEARAEGLNVVNLLLSQWGHLFTNTEEFTGEPLTARDGRTIVYASQENRQHLLGHLTLLGLKRPVMPWCSDGPGEAELGGGLDVTLSHWADACRAQGGTVILPHLPAPNGEPAALIATGRADAVEMLQHRRYSHLEYYRYLNGGYRLPLVGGTDKMDSQVPVGLYRTYVQLRPDEPFSYAAWCAGLRAGRTFLSGGALVWLEVDGHEPGDTLRVGAGGTVEVVARARSIFPLGSLEVVQGGEVAAATESMTRADGLHTLELRARLRVEGDTWLAARCAGAGYAAEPHFDVWRRGIMAHTSPVYVTTGAEYARFDPATARYMLTLVEGSLAYVRGASPQYPPGEALHHHGEADHLAYLERPFLEARAALHQRLHVAGLPH